MVRGLVQGLKGVRRIPVSALCALMLVCVSVPYARAGQTTTDNTSTITATKKPATPKSGAKKRRKPAAASSGTSHTHAAASQSSSRTSSRKKKTARTKGQQKIDSDRAMTIQTALIREHYLNGEATGTWNPASEEAMRRYQGDHGWQTKVVPDSRALITLGLGPSKDHLLNPDSAMTTGPDAPRAQSLRPTPQAAPAPPSSVSAPASNSVSPQ
jgi:hypothetical protein